MLNQPNYDLATLRAEFPLVERFTYLNHAGISPLPTVARRAVNDSLELLSEPCGEGKNFFETFTVAHRHIAALINGNADGIAMMQNTAEGMNIAAHALPLQAGDNVLVCDQEYPAVAYPFLNLSKLRGIETRVMPNDQGGTTVELLERHADARTRAVAVSSVEFATGFRADLVAIGEWCRSRNVWFLVDGIQSLGAAPMDVQAAKIDIVASGGHKWMMAPMGQGFMWVNPERLDELTPPFVGASSVANAGNYLDYNLAPAAGAHRFELGVPNMIGTAGLAASLGMLLGLGIDNIQAWTLHLTNVLIQELDRLGYQVVSNRAPERRSAIVLFKVPGEGKTAEASKKLEAANVVHSLRSGSIRIAPHCYNTEAEVCRVTEILGKAQ